MRELILDTETTGLDPHSGHRITEIGIVETIDRVATGRYFHQYINPDREIDAGATAITGHTWEALKDQPKFEEMVEKLLDFMQEDPIVAHNAPFDMGFLNMEMERCGKPILANEVVDTLDIARKKFPGSRHSLDALCQRFDIDLSDRTLHGALLDAKLLADVYLELTGGRQTSLMSTLEVEVEEEGATQTMHISATSVRISKVITPTEGERANQKAWLNKLEHSLWNGPKPEEK